MFRDIGALLDFVKTDMGEGLDSSRIAVMGGFCTLRPPCAVRPLTFLRMLDGGYMLFVGVASQI